MRLLCIILFILLIFQITPNYSYASSTYVLPYPSIMPGSALYKFHVLWEKLMSYWYFGSLAQFEYNLKESDKYLVEAKTLCEYNQYLLCYKALVKSNIYFKKISPFLLKAKIEGKDITIKQKLFMSASEKHIEVLNKIKQDTPENFFWRPEKGVNVNLPIHKEVDLVINQISSQLSSRL